MMSLGGKGAADAKSQVCRFQRQAPATVMVDIATGNGDFLRGAFLWYGLLRWRRVEVEQALNSCSPPPNEGPKARLEARERIAL